MVAGTWSGQTFDPQLQNKLIREIPKYQTLTLTLTLRTDLNGAVVGSRTHVLDGVLAAIRPITPGHHGAAAAARRSVGGCGEQEQSEREQQSERGASEHSGEEE